MFKAMTLQIFWHFVLRIIYTAENDLIIVPHIGLSAAQMPIGLSAFTSPQVHLQIQQSFVGDVCVQQNGKGKVVRGSMLGSLYQCCWADGSCELHRVRHTTGV